MVNEGLVQGQHYQDLQANKGQDNIENQNEKQDSQEGGYLNFHNYIRCQSNEEYWTAQISNDEKYLTIARRKRVQIYYLKNKKHIKNLKLDHQEKYFHIRIIFSYKNKILQNASYLLLGDFSGYLYCSDQNNNFKIIYNQKVHSDYIIDIFTIDQILTSSDYKFIIITDIKNNQQLLKIENAHTSWIFGIDFDKSTNIIISCSQEGSIKFFNREDGRCQIEYQNAHEQVIQMIQYQKIIIQQARIVDNLYYGKQTTKTYN